MIGSTAVITYKGKLLLFLRDNKPGIYNPNKWGLVGGKVEAGETYEQTIKRECKEEINVTPSNLKYLGESEERGRFVAELTDEEFSQLKLGDEGQKIEFFSLEEMADLELTPKVDFVYKNYRVGLEKILKGEDINLQELGFT